MNISVTVSDNRLFKKGKQSSPSQLFLKKFDNICSKKFSFCYMPSKILLFFYVNKNILCIFNKVSHTGFLKVWGIFKIAVCYVKKN